MPNRGAFLKPEGVVAVAIDKDDKNSQHAVRWVVDNLEIAKQHGLVLVHVRTQNNLPPEDMVPKGGRQPTTSELKRFFLPYRGFCARNKIHSKEIVLNDLDVASALAEYIKDNSVDNIVLGASNRGAIAKAFKNPDVPTNLSKLVPEFCSVYVASKDRVSIVKKASRPPISAGDVACKLPFAATLKARDPNCLDSWSSASSELYSDDGGSRGGSETSSSCDSMISLNYGRVKGLSSHLGKPPCSNSQSPTVNSAHFRSPGTRSPSRGQFMTATEFLQTCNKPGSQLISPLRKQSNKDNNQINNRNTLLQSSGGSSFTVSGPSSWESSTVSLTSSSSSSSVASVASVASVERDEDIKRLRLELKETMEMCNIANNEVMAAKMKAQEIDRWKSEHLPELVTQKQKSEVMIQYRRYSIEEIETATDYLSPATKIGEGGYGPVYKGYLDHTLAAIKVLRHDMLEGKKQFDKEIEVLSSIRHPNLVLLLGACPEYGCLAYEFLENGSLEDRLFCKGDTPPIPWKIRFRIAAEIASGLYSLHHAQPVPLVHRDLKPANILLDRNFVSKIGDVGLARMLPSTLVDGKSQYCLTAAVGTFCYIDPEYQQTGKLGTKSDIYSLGIILLQILTAKPPMGLAYSVGNAIETGKFEEILDPSLKDWPVEEALSLAKLGLQCCELRKKDRPDLDSVILPELARLGDL